MKVEHRFETPRPGVMISTGYAQRKMVEEHFDFPCNIKGMGLNISTDKAKTNGES